MTNLLYKASIVTTPTAYGVGVLNSIKPAIPFGEELIVNGNFSTDSDWAKVNATISSGQATITVTGGGFSGIGQTLIYTSGRKYRLIANIKGASGSSGKQLRFMDNASDTGGLTTSNGVVTLNESVQNIEIIWTANSNSNSIRNDRNTSSGDYSWIVYDISIKEMTDADFQFTRTSSATRVNPDYLIETVATDIPRLDYTNGTASILLENQSTNLFTYSQDFSQSVWQKNSVGSASAPIIASNFAISPDGTQNATRVQFNISGSTSSDRSFLENSFALDGSSNYTLSFYIKSNTGVNQDLSVWLNSVYGNIITVTNKWVRVEQSFSSNSTFNRGFGLAASGNIQQSVDVLIFGAMLEQQSFSTSLINTSGSIQTRAAETLNNAANRDLINSTEGVLYAEISALSDDLTFRTITLSDGTTSNNVGFGYRNNSNVIYTFLQGVINSSSAVTVSNITDFNKVAIKYNIGDYAMWINGVEVYTNTTSFTLNGLSEVSFDNGSGAADFYGKCKTVAVFSEALSDTELACLTSTNNREIFLNYYYRMQYVGANTEALSCAQQTFNI